MHIFHTERTNYEAIRIFTIFNCLHPYICAHSHAWQCTRCVDGTSSILLLWTLSWNPWKLQGHGTSLSQVRDALLTTLVPQRAPASRVQMGLGHKSPSLSQGFGLQLHSFSRLGEQRSWDSLAWSAGSLPNENALCLWNFSGSLWHFCLKLYEVQAKKAMGFSAKNLTVTFAWASSMQRRHYFSLQYNQVPSSRKPNTFFFSCDIHVKFFNRLFNSRILFH